MVNRKMIELFHLEAGNTRPSIRYQGRSFQCWAHRTNPQAFDVVLSTCTHSSTHEDMSSCPSLNRPSVGLHLFVVPPIDFVSQEEIDLYTCLRRDGTPPRLAYVIARTI